MTFEKYAALRLVFEKLRCDTVDARGLFAVEQIHKSVGHCIMGAAMLKGEG